MVIRKGLMRIALLSWIGLVIGFMQPSCSQGAVRDGVKTLDATAPDIRDGGFLSGIPCGPPCFHGVVPGSTTREQAISILQSNNLYQGCRDYDNSSQGGVRGITCPLVEIDLQNNADLVSGIGFSSSIPVTVREVIAKYGEPSAVSVGPVGPTEKEYITGMTLFYDNIKTALGLAEQQSERFVLTPDTLVAGINYEDDFGLAKIYVQKWEGYGDYGQ